MNPPADPTAQIVRDLKEKGDCHVSVEQWLEARMCYLQASILAPDSPEPYIGLGVVALQHEEFEEAIRNFQTALHVEDSCCEAYRGLAMSYQEMRKFPQAFEMYLRCLELEPDNLVALLGLFQTSCQMGTFSKIIHYLELYIERHPSDTAVMFCLATLYARERRYLSAKQMLLTVLAAEPRKEEALSLLTDVEQRLEQQQLQEVA
jgi:tetratricopeptide (TPR) repeat protein